MLLPGIIADGAALYLKQAKTLILSDLHIGYEEERRKGGVLLPQEQKKYFKKELDRLFKAHNIKTVILNGDIKHEFGTISKEEWTDVQAFIIAIKEKGAEVLAVGGNHDVLIKPILQKLNTPLTKALIVENGESQILIVHGDQTLAGLQDNKDIDKASMKSIDTIILGHEHPAMRLTDGLRTETAKCFLVGKQELGKKKIDCIVMPSWNPLTFGTDVLSERPLGPLLKEFMFFSAFVIIGSQVLAFGLVEDVRRL